MFEAISAFWTTMDGGLQRYVTSLAATLTADLLRKIGKKKGAEFEEALQEAYCEGLKHFLYTLRDERVDKEHLRRLLDNEDVMALFVKSVTKPPSPEDEAGITAALQNTGIDTSTIKGFSAAGALRAFQEGFVARAELSENLIPFLELQYLKELVEGMRAQAPDLAGLKRTYFTYLREKYGALSFRGLSEGKTVSFLLKDLYTNLSFSEEQPDLDRTTRFGRKYGRREALVRELGEKGEVTPADILAAGHAVITGVPGSGKSTLLKYIAIAFVDGEQKKRLMVKGDLLPILMPIAAYAEGLRKATCPGISLKEFISAHYCSKNLPDLAPLFEDARIKGQALYLMDGLDEVTDEAERQRVAEAVRDLIMTDQEDKEGRHRTNRYLVTCRTASYTGVVRFERIADRDFLHYSVLPFDRGHTESFLFKWYCCYEREINRRTETCEAEARVNTDQMMAAIDSDQNLADLATNPLMLTMLGLIEHEGGRLPDNRAELYAKCLRMFSGLWDSLRSLHQRERHDYRLGGYRIDEDFIVNYLGPIAFRLHESAQPEIEAGELKKGLAERFRSREKDDLRARQLADELLGILREESGILRETGICAYGFAHQTFREYLAARVLTDLDEDSIARLARLADKLYKPEWQEVVLLTAATLKQKAASQFIRGIYQTPAVHRENLILAGKCTVDAGRERIDDALYDALINSMMSVIGGDDPPPVRAAVGETLGWIGDPRYPKVLKGFIPVEGGRYNLSSGTITIKAFELGRYPITNAWFAEFINAGGYGIEEYWTEEGLKWLKEAKQTHPMHWNDRNWRCPNAPVVGVSWYEADAFTKWLTATSKDGYHYRLPSEAEWEAAAAGKEGRKYPWGNEWASDRCNTREVEIRKTSTVGIFRTGATPGGALIFDMAGNVWEWTVSDYETGGKVLRGGSWNDYLGDARCAVRFRFIPFDRFDSLGFRSVRTKT